MPFTNPATVSVPLEGLDFFFWPAMSGERYAPALTGGAAYSQVDGFPSYWLSPGSQLQCPYVARRGANQATVGTVTLSWKFYVAIYPNPGASQTVSMFSGQQVQMVLGTSGYVSLYVSGYSTTGALPIGTGGWYDMALQVSADTTPTLAINGATVATVVSAFDPVLAFARTALTPRASADAGGGGQCHVSQLRVTYG